MKSKANTAKESKPRRPQAKRPVGALKSSTPASSRASKQKARTRAELLGAIQSEHNRLVGQIALLTAEQMVQPGVVAQWSVRDILAHLTAWEARLVQRVQGEPERGVDMKTPAFNELIYHECRNRALDEVRTEFDNSYSRILEFASSLTGSQIARWWTAFAFNTHGHYRWANQQIRKWAKKA